MRERLLPQLFQKDPNDSLPKWAVYIEATPKIKRMIIMMIIIVLDRLLQQ